MSSMNADSRSRLRLVVIQALVFSLFATLLVRLWYLQVVTGEEYTAQAASQSVREVVVQPQRGLIVDDQGRPLVANRTSWVVSVDRGTLAQDARGRAGQGAAPGRQGDRGQGRPDPAQAPDLRRRGQQARRLLERLAHPAGAGRGRRAPAAGAAGARAARGLPGRAGRPADRACLPAAVRHQPRARARLPQPDHRRRARRVDRRTATARSTAPRSSAGPGSRSSTTPGCAACPATRRWRSTRWAGSSATTPGGRAERGRAGRRHPGHLDRRQGAERRGAAARRRDRQGARHQGPGHQAQLRRRLRRGGGHGGLDRPDRVDGQPADVRPGGLGRRGLASAS